MSKGLLHVAARDRAEEKLIDRLLEEAERQSGDHLSVAVLSQVRTDPLGSCAPFRGTLELRASAEPSLGVLAEAVRDLASRIEDVAHADLSSALFGVEHPIVPCAPMPVRYQYLMRRRVDFSHERYLERYLNGHAQFGRQTPGVAGYSQVHVDPRASRELARAAGFGIWGADSVSELHMESLEDFVKTVSKSPVAVDGPRDEEAFVDRANSVGFSSDVVRRFGPGSGG